MSSGICDIRRRLRRSQLLIACGLAGLSTWYILFPGGGWLLEHDPLYAPVEFLTSDAEISCSALAPHTIDQPALEPTAVLTDADEVPTGCSYAGEVPAEGGIPEQAVEATVRLSPADHLAQVAPQQRGDTCMSDLNTRDAHTIDVETVSTECTRTVQDGSGTGVYTGFYAAGMLVEVTIHQLLDHDLLTPGQFDRMRDAQSALLTATITELNGRSAAGPWQSDDIGRPAGIAAGLAALALTVAGGILLYRVRYGVGARKSGRIDRAVATGRLSRAAGYWAKPGVMPLHVWLAVATVLTLIGSTYSPYSGDPGSVDQLPTTSHDPLLRTAAADDPLFDQLMAVDTVVWMCEEALKPVGEDLFSDPVPVGSPEYGQCIVRSGDITEPVVRLAVTVLRILPYDIAVDPAERELCLEDKFHDDLPADAEPVDFDGHAICTGTSESGGHQNVVSFLYLQSSRIEVQVTFDDQVRGPAVAAHDDLVTRIADELLTN